MKLQTKQFSEKDVGFVMGCATKIIDIKQDTKNSNVTRVVGIPSTFHNIDYDEDRIMPGAFSEAIKENPKWKILRFHDSWKPLGQNDEAKETAIGLETVALISNETQDGKEQLALSKLAFDFGGYDARSIGFSVRKESYENDENGRRKVRNIELVKMWEDSFVTWGANPMAHSTGFKMWVPDQSKGFGIGQYVDEFFKFMESLGHKANDVKDLLIKEELQKQLENERIMKLMNETISILNGGI